MKDTRNLQTPPPTKVSYNVIGIPLKVIVKLLEKRLGHIQSCIVGCAKVPVHEMVVVVPSGQASILVHLGGDLDASDVEMK